MALGAHVEDGDDVVDAHAHRARAEGAQRAGPEVGLHLDGQRAVAVQRVDARLGEAEGARVERPDRRLPGEAGRRHGARLRRLGRDYPQLKSKKASWRASGQIVWAMFPVSILLLPRARRLDVLGQKQET